MGGHKALDTLLRQCSVAITVFSFFFILRQLHVFSNRASPRNSVYKVGQCGHTAGGWACGQARVHLLGQSTPEAPGGAAGQLPFCPVSEGLLGARLAGPGHVLIKGRGRTRQERLLATSPHPKGTFSEAWPGLVAGQVENELPGRP